MVIKRFFILLSFLFFSISALAEWKTGKKTDPFDDSFMYYSERVGEGGILQIFGAKYKGISYIRINVASNSLNEGMLPLGSSDEKWMHGVAIRFDDDPVSSQYFQAETKNSNMLYVTQYLSLEGSDSLKKSLEKLYAKDNKPAVKLINMLKAKNRVIFRFVDASKNIQNIVIDLKGFTREYNKALEELKKA